MICGHCKGQNVTVAHVRGCTTTASPSPERWMSKPAPRRTPERTTPKAPRQATPARITLDDLYDGPFPDAERCARCAGTGMFITSMENGQYKGPGGPCFRCAGKGRQSDCGPAAHAGRVLEIANGERDMHACCDRVRNDLYDRFGIRIYL